MWLIIPAVLLGEAAMAACASWCILSGSKTYHRSLKDIEIQYTTDYYFYIP